ncbi:hypothetical protein [Streptomyces sp. NPDC127038]|uniref:hypothetical protein n=1 Tax=Streptomyces sp. NPDC127038 TaxID=3347114 RepID=UPI003653D2C1
MLVEFRLDLPGPIASFVAVLVLGVVLVMSSPVQAGDFQERAWLLSLAAGLALGVPVVGGRGRR